MNPGTCGPQGRSADEDDQRHGLERRGSEKLVEAAVRIAPLQVGIELEALRQVAFQQDALGRPLVRRLRRPESLAQGIDKHHPGHLAGMGHRIESGDEAAIRMPDEHHGRRDAGGAQQRMEVGDRVGRRGRLRHRVAAARRLADRSSRPVVGTDPRELGNRGENVHRTRRGHGPVVGGSFPARHDDDSRNPGTTALEVHLAAAADVHEAGEIVALCERRHRGGYEEKREEQGALTRHVWLPWRDIVRMCGWPSDPRPVR